MTGSSLTTTKSKKLSICGTDHRQHFSMTEHLVLPMKSGSPMDGNHVDKEFKIHTSNSNKNFLEIYPLFFLMVNQNLLSGYPMYNAKPQNMIHSITMKGIMKMSVHCAVVKCD